MAARLAVATRLLKATLPAAALMLGHRTGWGRGGRWEDTPEEVAVLGRGGRIMESLQTRWKLKKKREGRCSNEEGE